MVVVCTGAIENAIAPWSELPEAVRVAVWLPVDALALLSAIAIPPASALARMVLIAFDAEYVLPPLTSF